jgi:lysophospholipase L1-like esterase
MKKPRQLLHCILTIVTFAAAGMSVRGEIVLANFSAGNPLKIMAVGDSITDDCVVNGAWRKPLQPLLETNKFPFTFVGRQSSSPAAGFTKLQHEGYCGAVVAAPGIFGAHQYPALQNYLQKVVPDALAIASNRPDVMLILIGANDIGNGRNPFVVATNHMATLLNIIFSNAPNVNVVLTKATRQENYAGPVNGANIPIYNAALQAVVNQRRALGQKVYLADLYSVVSYPANFSDGLHPNAAGLAQAANEWLARLQTITVRTDLVTTVLINGGATWNYNDSGQDLGTNWTQSSYNDSGWSKGVARLGYGDTTTATTVSYGPQATNKYVTTYFRRAFVVPQNVVITNLNLRVARADGVVVWLNGQDIYRTNLPAGPITYTNRASSAMTYYTRQIFYPTNVPVNLAAGTNWIAVEVHLSSVTATAMGFDMELIGTGYPLPPTITTQPVSQTVSEGGSVTFAVNATGTPPLRYQWKFGGSDITDATNASLTLSNVRFGDAGGYSVKVSDANGSTNSAVALLTVNRLPVANSQTTTLDEDTFAAITLTASDADGDSLAYTVVDGPTNGVLSGTAPDLVYHPQANYFGPDGFTFKVSDGLADSGIATVTINVSPVNDPPLGYPQTVSLDEDTALAITLVGFDVEGSALFYTVNAPAHGKLSGVAPNLVYTPNTNYFGPDSFTFKVNDGQLDSAESAITINVLPVNDAPEVMIEVSPLTGLPGVTNLLVIACNNTDATVTLDGSQSWDVENDPLQYSWLDGTNLLATSVNTSTDFAVGTHDVTLLVNDGHDTAVGMKTVEVITPAQSIGLIIDQIDSSALSRNRKQPLIASLQSAAAAFDREGSVAAVNQLQAFQNKLRAQVAPLSPSLAQSWNDAAQAIIDASCNP